METISKLGKLADSSVERLPTIDANRRLLVSGLTATLLAVNTPSFAKSEMSNGSEILVESLWPELERISKPALRVMVITCWKRAFKLSTLKPEDLFVRLHIK